jgi:hypothetical protein
MSFHRWIILTAWVLSAKFSSAAHDIVQYCSTIGTGTRVKVQQLTVVVVPLLTLEPRRHQLSSIRLWLR